MKEGLGKKLWVIPDCELPEEGEGVMKGHESVIVVNDNDVDVDINVTLYFSDQDCYEQIVWKVGAKRVRCFHMNNKADMCGFEVPYGPSMLLQMARFHSFKMANY